MMVFALKIIIFLFT